MSQSVECPICFKYMDAKQIQRHVDRCIDDTQVEADRHLANSLEIRPRSASTSTAAKNSSTTVQSAANLPSAHNRVIVNNAPTSSYQVVTRDRVRAESDPIQAQLSALHAQLVTLQDQQAQIKQLKRQLVLAPSTATPPPSPHTPRQPTRAPEHVTAQQRFAHQLAQFQQKFQNWHVPVTAPVAQRVEEDVKASAPLFDFSASELEQFDSKWLRTLKRNPEDERTLISAHLDMVLTLKQHRLGAALHSFAQTWYEPYQRMSEPSQETLQQVTELLEDFTFKLLERTVQHYEPLRHPQRLVHARETIRNHVLCAVYPQLFELITKRYEAEDLVHDERMREFSYIHPAHLGIKREMWLTADIALDAEPAKQPYARAIATLQLIGQYKLASSKLHCLVDAATNICASVLAHWRMTHVNGEPAPVIGGDELLPLMAYCLVKANVPHIYSHVAFMELFIDDQMIMQREGYLLATAQTALALICCLDARQIEQSLKEVDSTVVNTIAAPLATAGTEDSSATNSAPLDSAPLDSAPLDSAPLDSAPLDSAPLDSAPLDSAPLAPPIRTAHLVDQHVQ